MIGNSWKKYSKIIKIQIIEYVPAPDFYMLQYINKYKYCIHT